MQFHNQCSGSMWSIDKWSLFRVQRTFSVSPASKSDQEFLISVSHFPLKIVCFDQFWFFYHSSLLCLFPWWWVKSKKTWRLITNEPSRVKGKNLNRGKRCFVTCISQEYNNVTTPYYRNFCQMVAYERLKTKKKIKSLISKSDDGRLREVVANKIISSTHDLALHTMKFRSSLQY